MADPLAAIRRLLVLGHHARPEDLPGALTEVAGLLDLTELRFYLVDYGQLALRQLRGAATGAETADARPAVPVEGTMAGRAFCTAQVVRAEQNGGTRLWLPLLGGAERLGVLEAFLPGPAGERIEEDLEAVASVVADLVSSRRFHGDAIEHTRRRLPMQLAAEIIWNQLPPMTFAGSDVVVTAVLEPCYDVGGDAFDYAVNGDVLHIALFDTVGHGINASALTTLALNSYRNARRCGLDLVDTYCSIDKWIRAQYPGSFVTAILAELDTAGGGYRRICAGHPTELLLRDGRLVRQLPGPSALPLGLGHLRSRPPGVTEEALQPGDCVLLYTDGVIEARAQDGEFFGVDRLATSVIRALADRSPVAETMRRLVHAILTHQHDELQDDATAALLQWRPG